ncbi:hypothetical protein HPB47_019285, partial [Ixodes persulcatus]
TSSEMASCGLFSADEPPPEVKTDEAFVTLATNDVYAFGALVLAYSLRDVHTSKKLVVLVTRDVGVVMKHLLSQVFDDIQQVTLLWPSFKQAVGVVVINGVGLPDTRNHEAEFPEGAGSPSAHFG